jgi:hypothetical protein
MAQCPGLELTGTLAGDPELVSDIVEGAGLAVVEAVAQAKHGRLVIAEVVHEVADLLTLGIAGGAVAGVNIAPVCDEVDQFAAIRIPNRDRERDGVSSNGEQLLHSLERCSGVARDLLDRRLVAERHSEPVPRLMESSDLVQ